MAITMQQLADKAGVSRSTVDRALNNRGRIDDETAGRIRRLAEELGYKPNLMAKNLACGAAQKNVGVILSSSDNIFFDDVTNGINKRAHEYENQGIHTIIKRTPMGFSVEEQVRAIDELMEEDISVLIITPINDPAVCRKLSEVKERGTEVIAISAAIEGVDYLAYIGCKHEKGGREAGNLAWLLHRNDLKPAIVIGSEKMLGHRLRAEGFTKVVTYYGVREEDIMLIENDDDNYTSYRKVTEMIKARPETNLVFFAAAGTEGGIRALLDSGIRGINIIAFDSNEITNRYLEEGIVDFIIDQDPYSQGRKAMEVAYNYIVTGQKPQKKDKTLNLSIMVRESIN